MKILRNLALLSIVAFIMFVETGCKKYEEGPAISLRSKKERVVNDWEIKKTYCNGKEIEISDVRIYFTFNRNWTGKYEYIGYSASGTEHYQSEFSWDFNDDKTKLIINYPDGKTGGYYTEVYTILKLYEKEMWWKREDGDDTYEYHLEPK